VAKLERETESCQSQRPREATPTVWLRFDSRARTFSPRPRERSERRLGGTATPVNEREKW